MATEIPVEVVHENPDVHLGRPPVDVRADGGASPCGVPGLYGRGNHVAVLGEPRLPIAPTPPVPVPGLPGNLGPRAIVGTPEPEVERDTAPHHLVNRRRRHVLTERNVVVVVPDAEGVRGVRARPIVVRTEGTAVAPRRVPSLKDPIARPRPKVAVLYRRGRPIVEISTNLQRTPDARRQEQAHDRHRANGQPEPRRDPAARQPLQRDPSRFLIASPLYERARESHMIRTAIRHDSADGSP